MIPAFAPNLRGRMPPALFSAMPFAKKPRFEGDPWATLAHSPWWFWMHSDACREDSKDTPYAHAIYRDKPVAPALRETWPDELATAAPSPKRVRAPQRELFAECAA